MSPDYFVSMYPIIIRDGISLVWLQLTLKNNVSCHRAVWPLTQQPLSSWTLVPGPGILMPPASCLIPPASCLLPLKRVYRKFWPHNGFRIKNKKIKQKTTKKRWCLLLYYWCYYPHTSRESVSPVCRFFQKLLWGSSKLVNLNSSVSCLVYATFFLYFRPDPGHLPVPGGQCTLWPSCQRGF